MVQSESPAPPASSPGGRVWHPWRLLPSLLVLATVLLIWATRHEVLLSNNVAYPVTLVLVGALALLVAISARPRARR